MKTSKFIGAPGVGQSEDAAPPGGRLAGRAPIIMRKISRRPAFSDTDFA
jgi:hypothetical protein